MRASFGDNRGFVPVRAHRFQQKVGKRRPRIRLVPVRRIHDGLLVRTQAELFDVKDTRIAAYRAHQVEKTTNHALKQIAVNAVGAIGRKNVEAVLAAENQGLDVQRRRFDTDRFQREGRKRCTLPSWQNGREGPR